MSRFAISDIHGCAETFKKLLAQIHFSQADELFLLGDYIDRGPNSKGVIDHIWHLQSEGYKVQCLKGNHEQMLLDTNQGLDKQRFWLFNGGTATSESFDANQITDIPSEYMDWIAGLPHYLEIDDYLLVHAGLNFDYENPMEDKVAMLWIRNWYEKLKPEWLEDRVIVHGHTPTTRPIIEKQLEILEIDPVLVIDNGCVYNRHEMGQLLAFDMDAKTLHFCPYAD